LNVFAGVGDSGLRRLDNKRITTAPNEIILFSCVRNEILRLPYFLAYHRALGISRFIFVDNESEDGTQDFLLGENDVHLFVTSESYAQNNYGVAWLTNLLNEHGTSHWTLTLDADELLIYPYCEQIGLREFTTFLDVSKYDALATFMLDMYSCKPIAITNYASGEPFRNVCNYFDSVNYVRDATGIPIRGGVRHRLFWEGRERAKPSPFLKKIPLVRWRSGLHYKLSTHIISDVRLSPVTGALQHFKFFSDFYELSKRESERKEHWDGGAQYAAYWDTLKQNPDLSGFYENSVRYESSKQLVQLGLVQVSDSYVDFARKFLGN
jgi:hypothetical protein